MIPELPPAHQHVYASASHEEIEALYADVQALIVKGKPADEIARKMVEAGWDSSFAEWYATAAIGVGAAFRPAPPAAYVAYPRDELGPTSTMPAALKKELLNRARAKFWGAIIGFFGSMALVGMFPGEAAGIAIMSIGYIGSLLLYLSSCGDYMLSKGQNRLLGLIGLFGCVGLVILVCLPDNTKVATQVGR